MPESTTLEPPQTPALADFDATFGLDDPPAPSPAPAPTPEPTPEPPKPDETTQTRTTPPKDPATGKFTKAEPGVPETGATIKPALPLESKGTGNDAQKPDTLSKTGEFEPPQVAKPSELRGWAKRMGTRAEQAEQRLSQLSAEVRQLKSNPQQSVDAKALTEELAATKKRLEEYEGELKVTRYERSGEYKEKYQKPYENAVRSAYNEVQELLVTVPNPNDPDNPLERQATAQDFDEVYSLPLGPATKLAKQKFGDAASIVIQHVKAIKDAKRAAVTAIDEHKGKAQEFEQQQTAQQKMFEEGRDRMMNEAITSIFDKYKDLFSEREGDPKWNEGISKGRGMANLAFSDRSSLTPVQSTMLDAQIYARLTGFPALKAENTTLKAERDALHKEIAELRGSGPGKTAPGAPKTENNDANLTLEQAFDKFVPA